MNYTSFLKGVKLTAFPNSTNSYIFGKNFSMPQEPNFDLKESRISLYIQKKKKKMSLWLMEVKSVQVQSRKQGLLLQK